MCVYVYMSVLETLCSPIEILPTQIFKALWGSGGLEETIRQKRSSVLRTGFPKIMHCFLCYVQLDWGTKRWSPGLDTTSCF